jgi:endonuclease III
MTQRTQRRCAPPETVDRLLLEHYGPYVTPQRPHLLDELLYFMLSTRTTTPACDAAFTAFRKAFPRHDRIPEESVAALAVPLHGVGLAQRRASDIRESWHRLREHFGRVTLAPLRKMPVTDAEAFLVSLPGIGIKVARCFLMFGLHAPVFAVDTHIWRLSQRLGWLPDQKGAAPHPKGVDAIQAFVPMTDPVSLHVNLIFLGRDFCNGREQKCPDCPLRTVCPSAKKRQTPIASAEHAP